MLMPSSHRVLYCVLDGSCTAKYSLNQCYHELSWLHCCFWFQYSRVHTAVWHIRVWSNFVQKSDVHLQSSFASTTHLPLLPSILSMHLRTSSYKRECRRQLCVVLLIMSSHRVNAIIITIMIAAIWWHYCHWQLRQLLIYTAEVVVWDI